MQQHMHTLPYGLNDLDFLNIKSGCQFMPSRRAPSPAPRKPGKKRKPSSGLGAVIRLANRRAHEQANRRGDRRHLKSVRAAIAATDLDLEPTAWSQRVLRWMMALVLLPACGVTTWTFVASFRDATLNRGFWQSPEFWYFTTGSLLMAGWMGSGLLRGFFLYLYVLGHELTHALFVLLFRGRVSDIHVSTSGGYITTNKTNLLIALSPYFVPFWSLVAGILFVAGRMLWQLDGHWNLAFYAVVGSSWTFHMLWTLWMIPRDQPDLRENGTLLSLVIIYLANLLLLVLLLIAAHEAPLQSSRQFGMDWMRNAIITADSALIWLNEAIEQLRSRIPM